MDLSIPADLLARADACQRQHACARDDNWRPCRVAACLDVDALVVHCKEFTECTYRHGSGSVAVCGCPVRIRIFRDRHI